MLKGVNLKVLSILRHLEIEISLENKMETETKQVMGVNKCKWKHKKLRNLGAMGFSRQQVSSKRRVFHLHLGGGYNGYNDNNIPIRLSSHISIVCNRYVSSLDVHIRNIWSHCVHLSMVLLYSFFHPLAVDSYGSRAGIKIPWRFTGPKGWKR